MAQLPTVGGNNDTWGTVLNEYLAVAHNSDGTNKEIYTLDATMAAGATSFILNKSALAPLIAQQLIIIDAYTSQAEIRKVSTVSGTTVTISSAVTYAHGVGDRVLVVTTPFVSTEVWGCKGDNSTDDHTGLQEAMIQAGATGVSLWLDGYNKTHLISQPLLLPPSVKIRHLTIRAKTGYAPAETNNAMLMTMQGNIRTFTAAASTDIFTTPTAHGLPADNIGVVFQGSSLPTGITAGKFYYARDRTTLTFKVSATSGGAAVDLSGDGAGTVYCEVASMSRAYLDDVYVDGNDFAGVNGILACVQQPCEWRKWRVDNCPGVGVTITGSQLSYFYNGEFNDCGTALKITASSSGLSFYGLNIINCDTRAVQLDNAHRCHFFGFWGEQNSIDVEWTASGTSNAFYGVSNTSDTFMSINDGADASYTISALRPTSSSMVIVDDDERTFSIIASQFTTNAVIEINQGSGLVAPEISPKRYLVGASSKTSAYTMTLADTFVRCSSSGAAFSISLPTATGIIGKEYTIKKVDASANAVTVDPSGSETIDGASTHPLTAQWQYVTIVSIGGGAWEIVANN